VHAAVEVPRFTPSLHHRGNTSSDLPVDVHVLYDVSTLWAPSQRPSNRLALIPRRLAGLNCAVLQQVGAYASWHRALASSVRPAMHSKY
jgi:hypothetical protein